jgi:hypothetical protein
MVRSNGFTWAGSAMHADASRLMAECVPHFEALNPATVNALLSEPDAR